MTTTAIVTALATALLIAAPPTDVQVPVPAGLPPAAAPPPGGAPTPTEPQIAFPGQYAPINRDRLRPTNPKACRNMPDPANRAACYEYVAGAWPGLERYTAANKELAAPKPRERRVVFLGDSITDNWSRANFGGFFPGKPYINRGIGGQTTGQMLVRFRADVVAARPRAVVILAGTNDVSGNVGPLPMEIIQGHLASLAELARAAGIKVVLASLLPVRDGMPDASGKPIVRTTDRPKETLVALNRWIADYARKNRHGFLDYHAAMADAEGALKPELTYDGLHPNAAGYAVMGPLAEAAITKAIGR